MPKMISSTVIGIENLKEFFHQRKMLCHNFDDVSQ
jgi:hypothetical protein